jgi:hypothetical protein
VIDPALLEHLHVRIEDAGLQNRQPPGPARHAAVRQRWPGRTSQERAEWCRA